MRRCSYTCNSRLPSSYILQNLAMLCALDLSRNSLSRFDEILALSALPSLLSLSFTGNDLPYLNDSERLTLLRALKMRCQSRDSGEHRHFRRGHADGRVYNYNAPAKVPRRGGWTRLRVLNGSLITCDELWTATQVEEEEDLGHKGKGETKMQIESSSSGSDGKFRIRHSLLVLELTSD